MSIPKPLRPLTQPFRKYYVPLILDKHEPDDEVQDYIPFLSKDVILGEIGANMGMSTRIYSQACKFVHSFEANPETFQILKRYTRKFGNVSVYNMALWNTDGQIRFFVSGKGTKYDSISLLIDGKYESSVMVNSGKLDDLECSNELTALAIDTEGAEVAILEGAKETLDHINLIMVETHYTKDKPEGTSKEVRVILDQSGFSEIHSRKSSGSAQDVIIFKR